MKRNKLLLVVIVSIVLLLVLSAFQVEDPGDLTEVLIWLALGPGAVYIAGLAISILLEKVPGWGTRIPEALRPYVILAISAGLMFGSQVLLGQEELLAQVAPVYKQIVVLITAWLGTQVQFLRMKAEGLLGSRS